MKTKKNNQVGVIGAGSWGTALAGVLAKKEIPTYLWGHRAEHIEALRRDGRNNKYLPDLTFPPSLTPIHDLKRVVDECAILCMVVPSQQFRGVFQEISGLINQDTTIISAAKGIENDTLATMTEVMAEEIKNQKIAHQIDLAVLSGPSFAKEVAAQVPTAITIGCENTRVAEMLQNMFGTEYFRVYTSTDLQGIEISAAFKNIIALATGICDGLGYGLNTRAALITRGLAEITRLGIKRGADPLTFSGLSGLGDLILTCTGDLSRNRQVGLKLGQGQKLGDILAEMNMVAEGVKTTLSGFKLAAREGIEMPILEQVHAVLYEDKNCAEAVKDLLQRDLKAEQGK